MTAPDCLVCGGACCETFVLPWYMVSQVDREWLTARGRPLPTFSADPLEWPMAGAWEIPARCPKLGPTGLCTIYETRPGPCRSYQPGGMACLNAIRRLRTTEQQEAILGRAGRKAPKEEA